MNTSITTKDMIAAIPAEERYGVFDSLLFVAEGTISWVITRETTIGALREIAKVANAVAKIPDSIFKSRNVAYDEPNEYEMHMHEIKNEWRDMIAMSLNYVADVIQKYGENVKQREINRNPGATTKELFEILNEAKPNRLIDSDESDLLDDPMPEE